MKKIILTADELLFVNHAVELEAVSMEAVLDSGDIPAKTHFCYSKTCSILREIQKRMSKENTPFLSKEECFHVCVALGLRMSALSDSFRQNALSFPENYELFKDEMTVLLEAYGKFI